MANKPKLFNPSQDEIKAAAQRLAKESLVDSTKLEIGKTYNVVSERKGEFKMRLTYHDETWATGIITKGKAKAICQYNEVEEGEEVTIRKSFSTITAVCGQSSVV